VIKTRRLTPSLDVLRHLAGDLTRPSTRPDRVAIGWGEDPYAPRRSSRLLMPRLLAILADFAMPTSIRTHSPLIVCDIAALAHLARTGGLRVAYRIATLDDVRIAAQLAQAGIDVDTALLRAIGGTLGAAIGRARIAPEAPRQLRLNIAV
jgi:DNA repair photolyase